jgi:superfamily II DNA or RNA helicase
MIDLYEHQKSVIAENKKRFGNWRGTGSGKTLTTLMLAQGKTLVIVPKQQFLERMWSTRNIEYGTMLDITEVSKEQFRANWQKYQGFDTVIIDEAHNHFGVDENLLYDRKNRTYKLKTSQLFEATLNYIRTYRPDRFYLLTATPVTRPMHLYAIAKLFGHDWDFEQFRQKYYRAVPIGRGTRYEKRKSKELDARLVEVSRKFGYTGTLFDFEDVPKQTHITKYFEMTKEQNEAIKKLKESDADPNGLVSRLRTIENGVMYYDDFETQDGDYVQMRKYDSIKNDKIDYIIERAAEFPKIVIFAAFRGQVYDISKALQKAGYEAHAVTGDTKNRGSIFLDAEKMDKCILVVQSNISAGYELKTFRATIYASYSNRVLDKIQADGRTLRAGHLQKNLYISLVTRGGYDEKCYKAIQSGVDFNEKVTSGI